MVAETKKHGARRLTMRDWKAETAVVASAKDQDELVMA
jgi:hypothetical protein